MQRHFPIVLLLGCVAAFALGLTELFKLRFDAGDVYPPYSSLRSDPLGASALYESLERVPGITVSRDFRMSDELPEGRNIAYLQLAGQKDDWDFMDELTFKEVESFARRGGRMVVAFFPETYNWHPTNSFTSPTTSKSKSKSKKNAADKSKKHDDKKKMTGDDEETFHGVSIKERWGVDFGFETLTQRKNDVYEPVEVENDDEPSLPSTMPWHSGMVFKHPDKSWRVIYSRGADPVLIERKFGSGSVVLATDSFFLSNEALESERHAELLAWIVGPCRQVMFDEAHLGIYDNPGVAMLVRKYRLHGLVAGLLILAGLFIWKNSISFVPPHREEEIEAHVTGKDSASGFINLLRRHIPTQDLLATCLVEWKKSFPKGKVTTARLERVQAVIDAENALPPRQRRPVQTYQAICEALKEPGNPH